MKRILSLLAVVCLCTLAQGQCSEALKAYVQRYPKAEPTDLYKLVFQDLYGPGHLLSDSAAAMRYIRREVEEMDATAYPATLRSVHDGPFPLYEYTLCDSNFVRVNLILVKKGVISLPEFVSALLRSADGMVVPDARFVLSHSAAFKAAYSPHYRIIRRSIFEREFLHTIERYLSVSPVGSAR